MQRGNTRIICLRNLGVNNTTGAKHKVAMTNRSNVNDIGLTVPVRLFEARKEPAIKIVASITIQ